ncbi:MAG: hypothetical protein HUU21_21130 [Polyangiaceae bacterium]|nr:hypothetical protein [Polyangiaceae bacterium]NUQ76051.1 hypothetical protein [Polyangiaceae bacterium]
MRVRSMRPEAAERTSRGLRMALVCGLVLGIGTAAGAGCLYPSDYTFDLPLTGQGGAGGGSTSTTGTTEDCSNGKDDDGDGQEDCADTDCGDLGYQCITSAPVGWTGYFALYTDSSGSYPECPNEFPSTIPFTGKSGLVAFQASCAPCLCGAVEGETCNLPDVVTVIEKSCGNAASAVSPNNLSVPSNWDGSCYAVGSAPGSQVTCGAQMNEKCNTSVKSDAPTVTVGSCMASGGEPTIEPVSWMLYGKACGNAPLGGGCEASQVCQPTPAAPFKSGMCIYKDGEQASCPGEPFTEKHVFFEDAQDTRDCSACSCNAPSGGKCSATITVYSDVNCTSNPTPFQAGSCGTLPAANLPVFGRTASNITVTPGTCASQGGEPTGSVTPTSATTFCCIP